MKKRWGKTEKRRKRKIERVKEKANQLSTVSKRNAAQFYKYTRLAKEKKSQSVMVLQVCSRSGCVGGEKREREREREGGECVPADTCHMAAQKA